MLNRIKIVELFKKLLSIVYKKRKKYYQLKFRELPIYKKLEKGKA